MHIPGDHVKTDEQLKQQCCQKLHCTTNYCYAAMSEKGIWGQCSQYSVPLNPCDGEWPWTWNHHQSDSERFAIIKAKSADEIKKGCCRMRCYGTMKSRNLKCPAGYRGRSEMDGHNPFGNDWEAKTDKEITEQCCTKLNQCSLKLREEGLDCADYGRVPGGEYAHAVNSHIPRCPLLLIRVKFPC